MFHAADASVYGEVLPQGITTYLQQQTVQPEDVFYDLGCGTGKVLLSQPLANNIQFRLLLVVLPRMAL